MLIEAIEDLGEAILYLGEVKENKLRDVDWPTVDDLISKYRGLS